MAHFATAKKVKKKKKPGNLAESWRTKMYRLFERAQFSRLSAKTIDTGKTLTLINRSLSHRHVEAVTQRLLFSKTVAYVTKEERERELKICVSKRPSVMPTTDQKTPFPCWWTPYL